MYDIGAVRTSTHRRRALHPNARPLPNGSPDARWFDTARHPEPHPRPSSSPATPQTKGRTAVFGAACAAVVLIGGYIPVYAIQFQQRKASG